MRVDDLQALVRRSHDWHFQSTTPRERLRDLQSQVAELVHAPDEKRQREELGDVAWSVLQLCNEQGLALDEVVTATIQKLDTKHQGKKVCLLGTSANPITNAHLTMGLEILALTDVDEVWYYLAGQHPWGKKMMPGEHRLEMVRRAIRAYRKLKACDFDLVHGPEMHAQTLETAEILRRWFLPAFPGVEFSWAMGSDVAQSFHQWQGADWMAANLRMFVIHRLGYDFDKANSILKDERHQYLKDNIVTSNISSSLVRERGRSYDHEKLLALVPDVVWEYLVEHQLLDPAVLR